MKSFHLNNFKCRKQKKANKILQFQDKGDGKQVSIKKILNNRGKISRC
jgi:hypothetical protein